MTPTPIEAKIRGKPRSIILPSHIVNSQGYSST